MAEDTGVIGYLSSIGYGDTQNGTYTEVGYVTDITPAKIEVNKVKKTTMTSPSYAHEKFPGLIDTGDVQFKMLFDAATETALYNLLRTTKWWRFEFPLVGAQTTPSNYKCQGFICGMQPAVPLDDKMESTIDICWTGKPVFTAGS